MQLSQTSRFTTQDLKIVFMGTPEFAVTLLDALFHENYHIAGVVTAPDKAAGRGMKMQESSVKKYATGKGLKILQPEKLKYPAFLGELRDLKADIQIVVAFRMLPEVVWNMPPMGTINLHASLLPQYRGAAPINWVIINGEKETGITTFKLRHEIDTGNILLQEKMSIGDDETAGELHDRMKIAGATLLIRTIDGLAAGTLQEVSQSSIVIPQSPDPLFPTHYSSLHIAPKISTETCRIDWNKSADEIHNLIRGLSPYPGAFTYLDDKMLKIFRSKKEITSHSSEAGSRHTDGKTYFKYACSNGFIHLLDVQLEGRKRMIIEDFVRGYKRD